MKISFEGLGENMATFWNGAGNAGIQGQPVKLSDNGTVTTCGAGERFAGVAAFAGEESAAVQLCGYVKLACSGTLPEVGYVNLMADGNGGVTVGAAGGEYLVLEVDSADGTVGIML